MGKNTPTARGYLPLLEFENKRIKREVKMMDTLTLDGFKDLRDIIKLQQKQIDELRTVVKREQERLGLLIELHDRLYEILAGKRGKG